MVKKIPIANYTKTRQSRIVTIRLSPVIIQIINNNKNTEARKVQFENHVAQIHCDCKTFEEFGYPCARAWFLLHYGSKKYESTRG